MLIITNNRVNKIENAPRLRIGVLHEVREPRRARPASRAPAPRRAYVAPRKRGASRRREPSARMRAPPAVPACVPSSPLRVRHLDACRMEVSKVNEFVAVYSFC